MSNLHYWWNAYGNFAPGQGNLPHLGQVIRYYRKFHSLRKEEVASILGYTKRYIEMLESDQNVSMPDLISRRVLLANVLHIPPLLLGLSSLALLPAQEAEQKVALAEFVTEEITADTQTMGFYESMLNLSWELYYTSSVQRASRSVAFCCELLMDELKEAKEGIRRDQFKALQSGFYRLSALIARERMEFDMALEQINQAILLASELNNAELIASSLIGRIRIYFCQQQYEQALRDAQRACFYADMDLLRDPLKGKCYQMAGEAQAYMAGENRNLQEKSLRYFEKAARIARTGNLEPDGSFVKTDLTSIYIEWAKALTLFRRFDEAHDAYAIARKKLSPELTRWHMNLLIEEAKTYIAEGDVSSCCLCLLDALPIVRAIGVPNREGVIRRLLEKCKQQNPRDEVVKRLEKMLQVQIARSA